MHAYMYMYTYKIYYEGENVVLLGSQMFLAFGPT